MAATTLGQYLQLHRLELHISRPELARRAGVTRRTVHRIEVGTVRDPASSILSRLCRALRLTPEQRLEALERAGEAR